MSLRWGRGAVLVVVAAFFAAPTAASAAFEVPDGAKWTEARIESTDGVKLHADVLRPKGLGDDAKTPVILSIGPYFNHSGQTGPAGPVEDTSYDPVGPAGPSDRFLDFIEGAKLMERGYTYVMVDLRGFGGSTGCLDWGGPGEQSDVVKAVEWAASRSWSTGKVGMYGKSYDGVTGLIGVNLAPQGLKAVVSQEPVYDLYRYLYGDGMRRQNSVLTPALYDAIDATPGPALDNPDYNVDGANDTQRPGCKPANWADQAGNDDHSTPYWRKRTLIPGAKGSDVPLFLTQGLTENNTVADGTAQYMENHTGFERAWLGPWEHVRGNETEEDGTLKMGRAGWFDEVIRFYDRFLKGKRTKRVDPRIAVQTNDGKWRSEDVWPPADATGYASALLPGTYTDDGDGSVTGDDGVWTISPALPYDAHLAGSGTALVNVSSALPRGNLVVDVYDLSQEEDGSWTGPLITRQGHMIYESGRIPLDLWSADWKIAAGHRIGVRVTDANSDWWVHVPTFQDVTVEGGRITLPFLANSRNRTIQGDPGTQLEGYLAETVTVPPETVEGSESDAFALPPRMDSWDPATATAGPAQPPIEGTVTTKAPGGGERVGGVTSEYFEFEVDAVHDNAKMRGVVTPSLPADLDLYLQRQREDGTWKAAGEGANGGSLENEKIGKSFLQPGRYRLEVHNWAGPPGNQVEIKLKFLNSAGEAGV